MELFKAYLTVKGLSKATIQGSTGTVERFKKWAETENIPEESVSYNDVLAYVKHLQKKGIKQITVSHYVNALRHYFDYLQNQQEVMEDNPASNIRIKGIKRRILYEILKQEELEEIYKNFKQTGLAGKRNKTILGLMIYQGLKPEELAKLTPQDAKLREGKIYVPGGRKSNEREIPLEAHQVIDLMEYINETRKLILAVAGKDSDRLFVTMGSSDQDYRSISDKLMRSLRKQDKRIKDAKQIRASVITGWLKSMNLRKAQYLAGHRYVSSTEMYQLNDLEDLQEDINKYHPVG